MSKEEELEEEIERLARRWDTEGQNQLMVKLEILKAYDYNKFMNTMYKIFTEQEDSYVNQSAGNPEEAIAGLVKMIQYFEKREEYEKCARLDELKMRVEIHTNE